MQRQEFLIQYDNLEGMTMNLMKYIFIGVAFLATIFPIVLYLRNKNSDKKFMQGVENHNKNVVFKYRKSENVLDNIIKSKDFLRMKNAGNHPCAEKEAIEVVDYQDYMGGLWQKVRCIK